jgi:ATP-dependent exoDNAse (exonuclease V) beta subunit
MSDCLTHTVIRASAGTGKTYQLAVRFLGLLARGTGPDEILATTFTRKAAGEILDRVLHRLAEAASSDKEARQLADSIGDKKLTRAHCQELLVKTVRNLHRLRVGTLDSHFMQVAGSFALELGLTPGWSICEPLDDALLREEAIEQVLSRGRLADLLTLVHSLTKGEATRGVGQLVRDTVGDLFEMYRETSPAAWQQIPFPKPLPPEELDRVIDAVASFAIDNSRMATARDADVAKARTGDWLGLITSGLCSKVHCGECAYYKKPIPVELVGMYRILLKQVEAELIGPVARQTQATHDLLERFAGHYHALQLESGALRFSDVTHRLARSAELVSNEQLAFRLDSGIRHILLDEFQDTSPIQWQVLRPLAQTITSQTGGSFFCVGDAKQAIYGWRGGVAEIFDALDDELCGLSKEDLFQSYRSAQPVIDAVNEVFTHLTNHSNLDNLAFAVEEWQKRFPPHETTREKFQGYVTLETAPEATAEQNKEDVLFRHAADRIKQLAEQSPACSIGVLVRTNKAVGKLIYLLRRREILASEEGGNALVDSPAVELILSLLRLADHPGDSIARFHLATSPLAGPLELSADGESIRAVELSRRLRRQLLDEGYGATVHAWSRKLAKSCDRRDLSRLQQLVEMAYAWEPESTLRADDFIAFVESEPVADPAAANVRVMTIHQAKGLQFDIVVLPELTGLLTGQPSSFVAGRPAPTQPVDIVCRLAKEEVRQFFPPRVAALFEAETRRKVSESLCVLYVAMTRAVHALHMIVPPAEANERSMPKKFTGILRATLAPDKAATGGQTLYEHGNKSWYKSYTRQKTESAPGPPEPPAEESIRLAPPPAHRTRGLDRTSPSSLEGGQCFPAARLLEPKNAAAFEYGSLVHAWMEQIQWLDEGLPSDDTLRKVAARLASQLGHIPTKLDGPLANFRQQLAAPAVAALFDPTFYGHPENFGLSPTIVKFGKTPLVQALCEHRFAVREADQLMSGSIDRLVLISSGSKVIAADVIDFKTDDLTAGDAAALSAKVTFYAPQIEGYRRAVATIFQLELECVAARLVFLKAGVVSQL